MADDISMGLLVPEDFPLSLLANDDERIVVEALRDRLSDGWLIIPNVGLTGPAIGRPTS